MSNSVDARQKLLDAFSFCDGEDFDVFSPERGGKLVFLVPHSRGNQVVIENCPTRTTESQILFGKFLRRVSGYRVTP
jgi:hypothetical protein